MKKIVAVSMVAVLATTVFLSGCNTSKKNESSSDTPDSTTSSLSSDVKSDTIPQTTVESTNAVSSSSESSAGSKVSETKYKHLVDYYNSDEMKSVINSADDAYNNDIYTLRITCEGNSIVYNFRMVQTYTRYCQGTKLNTQDTLKSISKEIGFFYFDLKSELSRQRLKFKSKDGN